MTLILICFDQPVRGAAALWSLRAWGRQVVDHTPWQTIRHICGNIRFVYDGDNAAIGTTVLTVFMVAGEQASTTVPFNVGEDHDRLVRTEQGWRFRVATLGRALRAR